jgi:hypothetical protein
MFVQVIKDSKQEQLPCNTLIGESDMQQVLHPGSAIIKQCPASWTLAYCPTHLLTVGTIGDLTTCSYQCTASDYVFIQEQPKIR